MITDTLSYWIGVVIIALGTFAARFAFIGLQDRIRLPEAVRQGMRFIPPAVLTAIVVPGIAPETLSVSLAGNERLVAGLVAALVAWRFRNMLLVIVSGMVVLWTLM